MLKRSKCESCGRTAKENGDHLNKIRPNGVKTILCNECLPQAPDPTASPSDSGSRISELEAYGTDCINGKCEV